jgi:hypothetical protein
MYTGFRENKENLPGDEEILKSQKPTIKLYLMPFLDDNSTLQLPKMEKPQIIVPPSMTIEVLKKYLLQRLSEHVGSIDGIEIYFKNQKIQNDYTIKNVEELFKFHEDKIVFYYKKND